MPPKPLGSRPPLHQCKPEIRVILARQRLAAVLAMQVAPDAETLAVLENELENAEIALRYEVERYR